MFLAFIELFKNSVIFKFEKNQRQNRESSATICIKLYNEIEEPVILYLKIIK